MEPRISFVTLGVDDLARATRFYTEVLELRRLDSSTDEVTFFDMGSTRLALFPRQLLAADAGVVDDGSGFRPVALAHNVGSAGEVDELLAHVGEHGAAAGARVVKQGSAASWGGYTGYFADPDGFLWEVAWNPHFPHL